MLARGNIWFFAGFLAGLPLCAAAADQAAIDKAIARGRAVLKMQTIDAPIGVLAAYALVKTGEPVDAPIVQAAVKRIVGQVAAGEYSSNRNPAHHIYEAAISLLLLEAAGPDAHPSEVDAITQYLLARQNEVGAWYYPTHTNVGDTSITQYGLLGLWASARMGRQIPTDVWNRAGRWLLDNQKGDGGFVYHPHEVYSPTFSMTSAGTGSLMVVRLMLYGQGRPADGPPEMGDEKGADEAVAAPATASVVIPGRKRYGILEPLVPQELPKPAAGGAARRGSPSANSMQRSAKGSACWTGRLPREPTFREPGRVILCTVSSGSAVSAVLPNWSTRTGTIGVRTSCSVCSGRMENGTTATGRLRRPAS